MIKRLMASLLLIVLVLVSSGQTFAQQRKGASGLSISPTRFELTIQPGKADKIDIQLKNVTSGDIIAEPIVNDFEADNSTGDPKIIVDPNQKSPESIRDYVSGLDNIPLKAGEQKKVTLIIQLPPKIPAGAYFGIISYQAVPATGGAPKNNGEVALSATVGSIALVTVPGDIKDSVQLKSLQVIKAGTAGHLFIHKPEQVGVELKNLGNGFAKPFGKVVIRDIFGKQVYSYEINNIIPRANILPDSTRIFKDQIKNINKPGRYTVLASISYANGSDVLTRKTSFWYLPTWIALVLVAILVILAVGVWLAYRRYQGISRRSRRR